MRPTRQGQQMVDHGNGHREGCPDPGDIANGWGVLADVTGQVVGDRSLEVWAPDYNW